MSAVDVIHDDCLKVLARMPECSVDAVVTDPPSGTAFMGREWDSNRGGRDAWVAWLRERMQQCHRVLKPGAHAVVWALPRTSHWTAWAVEDAGFEIRDVAVHLFGQGMPKSKHVLKPAAEHWILARKPPGGSIARCIAEHGTGGLNIDDCRIEDVVQNTAAVMASVEVGGGNSDFPSHYIKGTGREYHDNGRWPANVTLDEESAELLDDEVGHLRPTHWPGRRSENARTVYGQFNGQADPGAGPDRTGESNGASRFFYVAKVKGRERGDNSHVAVKPVDLMRWLIRLVTPVGGLVLDCFAGSGTTGVAAMLEQRKAILIESNAEYVGIIRRRLAQPIQPVLGG